MRPWKVVFTDEIIHPEVANRLRETCTVQLLQAYPSEAAPRLRIIARHGAGSDVVDLPMRS